MKIIKVGWCDICQRIKVNLIAWDNGFQECEEDLLIDRWESNNEATRFEAGGALQIFLKEKRG